MSDPGLCRVKTVSLRQMLGKTVTGVIVKQSTGIHCSAG